MDAIELMTKFAIDHIAKDKRERWVELSARRGAAYKKLSKLETHLLARCIHVGWNDVAPLINFVKQCKPVWLWDFHPDLPICLRTESDILANINPRSAFLAVAEKSSNAIYFNGDSDAWLCGEWPR